MERHHCIGVVLRRAILHFSSTMLVQKSFRFSIITAISSSYDICSTFVGNFLYARIKSNEESILSQVLIIITCSSL